jgi:hypothetical protein
VVLGLKLRVSWLLGRYPTTWHTLPTSFNVDYILDMVLRTTCHGWPWTLILLISASLVARITVGKRPAYVFVFKWTSYSQYPVGVCFAHLSLHADYSLFISFLSALVSFLKKSLFVIMPCLFLIHPLLLQIVCFLFNIPWNIFFIA